jgi:hypothetical protein
MRPTFETRAALAIGILGVLLAACGPASSTRPTHSATASPNSLEQSGVPHAIDVPKHADASTAAIVYQGGVVQHHPHVYLVFWGPKWSGDTSGAEAALQTLFKGIDATAYKGILAQYTDGDGAAAQSTTLAGVWTDTSVPSFSSTEGGDEAQAEAERAVAANNWTPDADAQIMVFPQQGSAIDGFTTGDTTGDNAFCGWHDFDGDINAAYALIPYQTDTADNGCDTPNADATTATASHEWAEMATDPQGDAWSTSADNSEVGDVCSGTAPDGPSGTSVQSLWSNAAGKCVFS